MKHWGEDNMAATEKPALLWFKAQAPGIRHDGSSFVTLRFAQVLAETFELHLVCLPTASTTADPASFCVPPFASVTMVALPHQRSALHRVIVGGWYQLLDKLKIRPTPSSIEGARAVRRTLNRRRGEVNADIGVAEYWTSGRALSAMPSRTTLLLHDVEHEASDRIGAKRQAMIRRAELDACRAASKVVCLSSEDRSTFSALGLEYAIAIPVPSLGAQQPDVREIASKLCFVGSLSWGPNKRGFDWFIDEVWPLVLADAPSAEVHVIGAGPPARAGSGIVVRGFIADLSDALSEFDLAIVPTLDGTGVKTKTIEFLEAGLPIVATTNGVRGTSAAEGGARIANDPEGFARHVVDLLQDVSARRTLAEEGRTRFVEHHMGDDLVERLLP